MKSCRDSVCKLEFFGCPVFSSASVPCGICNCACSLRQTEVFSDFSLLVRTVRLPTFLFCFLDCRNEASRLRSLKQIVKFCRASVCKLELWLSGPQFCFYTLWDFHLRLFTSANCEVFSDFSLLVRTVRLLSFLFCFFFGLCWNEALRLRFLKQIVGLQFASWSFLAVRSSVLLLYPVGFAIALVHFSKL